MRSIIFALAIFLVLMVGLQNAAAQSLLAYIEAPKAETSSAAGLSGAKTETFNSLPLGNQSSPFVSAIGTFDFSPIAQGDILAADAFGGGGNSQYMSFGAQSGTSAPITIHLNGSYNYFGFWFSAGDVNNGITFYSGGTAFARFSTSNIVSLLSGTTVTALNGNTYTSSAYYGNPNNGPNKGQDGGEPFTYVEIFTSGQTFDTVVLDNSGTTGTGFESDNDTVYAGNLSPPTTDVFVGSLTVVPEPAHYALLFGACILLLVYGRRIAGQFCQRDVEFGNFA